MHKRTLPMLLDSVYYFRCGGCHGMFMTIGDLDEHMNKHAESGPCVKSESTEFCTDYQYLEDDENQNDAIDDPSHADALQRICSGIRIDDNLIICQWCLDFEAPSVLDIWEHFSQVHFQPESDEELPHVVDARSNYCETFSTVHKCGYCEQTFRWLKDAIPHVFFHASSFGCPFSGCTDSYLRFHLLNHHMERKHLDVDKHQCEYCHAVMDTYAQKQSHMRHECRQRPFACSRCGKCIFYYLSNSFVMRLYFLFRKRRQTLLYPP